MNSLTTILVVIFGLISFLILVSAYFSPIPRKIGFRNVKRRLGNTFLVILGSMVGTALISGSLVLSDSLHATFQKLVEEQVGEVDATIEPQSKIVTDELVSYYSNSDAEQIENLLKDDTDGILKTFQIQTAPIKLDSDGKAVINSYQVNMYGIEPAEISKFGETPQKLSEFKNKKSVYISQSAADSLELLAGDSLEVNIFGTKLNLTVQEILPNQGIWGGKTILIDHDYLVKTLGLPLDANNLVVVSAKGGIEPKGYDGKIFEELVEDKLDSYESNTFNLKITEIKQIALDGYGTGQFVTAFIAMSFFGILAGILLITNLYSMLASERKTEMGILRAIALSRTRLIQTFIYEGYVYSVLSSLLGTFVGLGIGYVLVVSLSNIFSKIFELSGGNGFEFVFDFTFASLFTAFLIGALITITTATFASVQISKLNIISAIKDIEDNKKQKFSLKWLLKTFLIFVTFVFGLGYFALSFVVKDILTDARANEPAGGQLSTMNNAQFTSLVNVIQGYSFYLGFVVMLIFFTILVVRIVKIIKGKDISRIVYTLISLILIGFNAVLDRIEFVRKATFEDAGAGIVFLVGVVLVISLSLIVSFNLTLITDFINLFANKSRNLKPVFNIGLKYPASNRARTGITLVMFALIIFLIAFISIEKAIINDQSIGSIKLAMGGYDAAVIPEPVGFIKNKNEMVSSLEKIEGVDDVQILSRVVISMPEFKYKDLKTIQNNFGDAEEYFMQGEPEESFKTYYSVLSPELLKATESKLGSYSEEYDSEKEVWDAVADDSSKVIAGTVFASGFFPNIPKVNLGDKIKIADSFGNSIQEKEVIGVMSTEISSGGAGSGLFDFVVISSSTVEKDFSQEYFNQNSSSDILVKFDTASDREQVFNQVKKDLIEYNVLYAYDINSLAGEIQVFLNSFISLFQGFLAFSLIVGTSGLAIIMVRSVNERKQQIGMLRSLGFQKNMVLTSFFVEATFITLIAIIIGISMGILGTNIVFSMASKEGQEFKVIIPWMEIFTISLAVYIASIIFALLPSLKAAGMSPVEATNYPE